MHKILFHATGKPTPGHSLLTTTPTFSDKGYYGRLNVVPFQLYVTGVTSVIIEAQGSIDGVTFGTIAHRRLDTHTVNANATYAPSPTPYVLAVEYDGQLAAVQFLYKAATPPKVDDECKLIGIAS